MTSIIKNQIIKHLSKFARNLKPEQISLEVLKGKSKLQFIEINEEVLTDVLELPPWLKIKRATCTGVTVNVPWTKLKSAPVQIFIDEINVEVVLNNEPRSKPSDRSLSVLGENTSYGFADKVVEGMSLYINTVEIVFDSDAFGGSFMLSRLSVESRTPGWQNATDLRLTRVSCPALSRVLIFKQISWQLLRIEASAKTDKNEKRCTINAPLRLITSGGKIRVALKKSSIDGSVINAQIHTLLEDILWVATLPQLRSAITFYSYIMSLVRQTQKVYTPVNLPTKSAELLVPNGETVSISNTFRAFDFDQTSYHLHIKKVDLHLCDDAHLNNTYPPGWDIESGAMQVTLYRVLIDVYPSTLATSDRVKWPRYTAPNDITQWIESRLAEQFRQFCADTDDAGRTRLIRCWPQLISFIVVIRIYDLVIQCVSDLNSKRESLQNVFASDRQLRSIPNDQYIFHFEFANFMHPMSTTLPAPAPASFMQLGPFSILFDKRTLRWCLYVIHNITTVLEESAGFEMEPLPHSDLRIDLLMPKVIIPLPTPKRDNHWFPLRLLISFSMLSLSNTLSSRNLLKPFEMLKEKTVAYVKQLDLLGGGPTFVSDLIQLLNLRNPCGVNELLWLHTSPGWVDTDHGSGTKSLPVVSDVSFSGAVLLRPEQINVYVEPVTEVHAFVDHFQYIQLTKLSDSLSNFLEVLAADQKHFLSQRKNALSTVAFFVAIKQVRAMVLLTMGAMPSPYDSSTLVSNTLAECLSDSPLVSRSNTPRQSAAVAVPVAVDVVKTTPTRAVEEFPEFKAIATGDNDSFSLVDDSMSIATSTEDESNFELDVVPEDDDLFLADIAEDATTVDDNIINDKIYRALMAKKGNILVADLESVLVVGNSHNKDLLVRGKVDSVTLSHRLNVARSEVYGIHRIKNSTESVAQASDSQVTFCVNAPDQSSVVEVEVDVKDLSAQLDDEVLAHLSAFVVDDDKPKNKVRLRVNVSNSNIEIDDRSKRKPLRIRIKECVIEQDEDEC